MKFIKLYLWIGSILLVGAIALSAQSTDAELSTPVAMFPVVTLGPEQQAFDQNVTDVLFDYDDNIVDDQVQHDALDANAGWLRAILRHVSTSTATPTSEETYCTT